MKKSAKVSGTSSKPRGRYYQAFSPEECAFIRKNYRKRPKEWDGWKAGVPDRFWEAIKMKAFRLETDTKNWSPSDDAELMACFTVICKGLGRESAAVAARLRTLTTNPYRLDQNELE